MPHYWRPLPAGFGEGFFRLRITSDPNEMANTIGFDFATEPTVANVNAIMAAYGTRIMPLLTNVTSLDGVHMLYQADANNQLAVDSTNAVVPGTYAGTTAILPPNSAYLVRKKTLFAGKRNRGRWYVPGVQDADVNEVGVLLAARITAWQSALNGLFTDLATFTPVIIHSVLCEAGDASHTGPHSDTPLPPTPITNFEIDNIIATQRRRLNR
jgi:hypothetical protein